MKSDVGIGAQPSPCITTRMFEFRHALHTMFFSSFRPISRSCNEVPVVRASYFITRGEASAALKEYIIEPRRTGIEMKIKACRIGAPSA